MRDERVVPGAGSPAHEEPVLFTCQEWVALLRLRRRYRNGQDQSDARQRARLSFMRWLRETGRIES